MKNLRIVQQNVPFVIILADANFTMCLYTYFSKQNTVMVSSLEVLYFHILMGKNMEMKYKFTSVRKFGVCRMFYVH